MTAVYRQPNKDAIDECMNRLSTAVQKFTVCVWSNHALGWGYLLKLPFLQLANDLRDSALIDDLHARLRKMANKVDDVHHNVEEIHHKVDDIQTFLKRSGMRPVSETLSRQEMPLKPGIFHGRDDMVEDIAQLLLQEETSHVCILGPGGMGKTSVSLAVVELPLIKERFSGGNIVWVPCKIGRAHV